MEERCPFHRLGDPVATSDELADALLALDVRLSLVLGVFFVAYLAVYLPKKGTSRSPRQP